MSEPAYDVCYYESMLQKNRYLFKLIARNSDRPFDVIRAYMESDIRKAMDRGNPLYLNKTPKQILGSLGIRANPDAQISEDYDEFILEWMADLYTYMQWKYNLESDKLVAQVNPGDLYRKYFPLHEASIGNAAEKLLKEQG